MSIFRFDKSCRDHGVAGLVSKQVKQYLQVVYGKKAIVPDEEPSKCAKVVWFICPFELYGTVRFLLQRVVSQYNS